MRTRTLDLCCALPTAAVTRNASESYIYLLII